MCNVFNIKVASSRINFCLDKKGTVEKCVSLSKNAKK